MIFTFYSYKGGVGRSMAMANVAEYYYRRGLRVLMIDWDLEAPGLETFFYNLREDANGDGDGAARREGQREGPGQKKVQEVRSNMGLLDLLLNYKRMFPSLSFTAGAEPDEKVGQLREQMPPLRPYLYPIHEAGAIEKYPDATLWLVPAGWREGERFAAYSQGVQSFNWSDFYESFEGQVFFEWMRGELERVADVILIDSRTGVTEMGGVCTRQLADVVVSFAVLNNQNLEGVARMNRSFVRDEVKEARGRNLEVIAVPTRIDLSELEIRLKLKELFQQEMGEVPAEFRRAKSTFWSLRIPYVSRFAYFEKLAIGAPEAEELENAYVNLATHLALLAPEESQLKARFAEDLHQRGVRSARIPSMAPALPEDYVRRPREYGELKAALVTDEGGRQESQSAVVVRGGAGFGKSLVAASVCKDRQVAAAFPDGVLWATLGVWPDVKEELTKLHAAVTGDTSSFKTVADAAAELARRLSEKSCLVVVDDVWSDEHLRPFLSNAARCTFVVTSRVLPGILQWAKSVHVGGLSAEQSARLLALRARLPEESEPELEAFAGRLGGNALLVKLAGDALQHELGGGLEKALEQLGRRLDARGPLAFDPPAAEERNRSFGESIAASLRLPGEEEMGRYVRMLFALEGGEASLQQIAEALKVGPDAAEETAKSFHALSLVNYDAGAKTVGLHPALRALLLERLPTNVALDVRAEYAFTALTPEKQALAARTLPRLVRLQGLTEAGRDERHLISIKEFSDASQELLTEFAAARVVSFEANRLTGERTVQLTDASLVAGWERLREWVRGDRQFLFWRQKLWSSIREWKSRQRSGQSLLSGAALAEATDWLNRRPDDLDETEKTYIRESVSARRRRTYLWLGVAAVTLLLGGLLLAYLSYLNAESLRRAAEDEVRAQQAQEERERKAREDKDKADMSNAEGLKALKGGDLDGAILAFSVAINSAPSSPDAYKNRARAYMQRGLYDLALIDLNRVIQLGASDAETMSLLDQARRSTAPAGAQTPPPSTSTPTTTTPSTTPTPSYTPTAASPPQPASDDVAKLIAELESDVTGNRRAARQKLIDQYPGNREALVNALMAALLPADDPESYRINLGVVTVLAGVGEWEGTPDDLQRIKALTSTPNYREPSFKAQVDRAIRNYRSKGAGAYPNSNRR